MRPPEEMPVNEILREYARALHGFDASIAGGEVYENPACGDRICFALSRSGGGVSLRWNGEGCALMLAGASLLSRASEGLSCGALADLIEYALGAAGGEAPIAQGAQGASAQDEALLVLSSFADKPVRRGCVLLPWESAGIFLKKIV